MNVVEDSLHYPNGIALAPGQKTLYLSDTGAGSGPIDPQLPSGQLSYVTTGKRTVYAYDLCSDGMSIVNKRPIYLSQDFVPDGVKVARNGYIVAATGSGVDVLDPVGTLLIRIQTNYTAVNFAWTGEDFETLWIVGVGGISRVNWNLKGQVLT